LLRGRLFPVPLGGNSLFGNGVYTQNVQEALNAYVSQTYYTTVSRSTGVNVYDSMLLVSGSVVTHLNIYENTAKTYVVYLVKRTAAGAFTCIKKVSITTATQGFAWQLVALPTPFEVPNDGGSYYLGIQIPGGSWNVVSGSTPGYTITAAFEEGTSVSGITPVPVMNPLVIGWVGYKVLQPQATYTLEGVGTLTNALVVTGVATVIPDDTTGAAVVQCENIVVTGASASLSPTTNCKGFVLLASKGAYAANGGKIHIDKLGKAGNFGDLTPYDLLPAACQSKVSRGKMSAYVIKGEGAEGAARKTVTAIHAGGNPGNPATTMQSGGGGGGGLGASGTVTVGAGGKGGPCCGGAGSGGLDGEGSGTNADAGPYGGPGSDGVWLSRTRAMGGGGGDPIGASTGGAENAEGAGGGLLAIFTPTFVCASTSKVSSAGAHGGNSNASGAGDGKPGGGTGGGVVLIVTRPGGYTNLGTVAAPGGIGRHTDRQCHPVAGWFRWPWLGQHLPRRGIGEHHEIIASS